MNDTIKYYSALTLLILSALILGSVVGAYFTVKNEYKVKSLLFEQPKDMIIVNNITLEEEANGLYNRLIPFFKYNISNLETELTDEQLKNEGGVCWHWANWYVKEAERDGFKAEVITFRFNEIP